MIGAEPQVTVAGLDDGGDGVLLPAVLDSPNLEGSLRGQGSTPGGRMVASEQNPAAERRPANSEPVRESFHPLRFVLATRSRNALVRQIGRGYLRDVMMLPPPSSNEEPNSS